jgi:hypothetical protein
MRYQISLIEDRKRTRADYKHAAPEQGGEHQERKAPTGESKDVITSRKHAEISW